MMVSSQSCAFDEQIVLIYKISVLRELLHVLLELCTVGVRAIVVYF